MLNKRGKVVSVAKSTAAKRSNNLGSHLKRKGTGVVGDFFDSIGLGMKKKRKTLKKKKRVVKKRKGGIAPSSMGGVAPSSRGGRRRRGRGVPEGLKTGFKTGVNLGRKLLSFVL